MRSSQADLSASRSHVAAWDEFQSEYSSQSMESATLLTPAQRQSGRKEGFGSSSHSQALQFASLDEVDGKAGPAGLKLPAIVKPAWSAAPPALPALPASLATSKKVNFGGDVSSSSLSQAEDSSGAAAQPPAAHSTSNNSTHSAQPFSLDDDDDDEGGAPEVIPSTPIDAAITIKFQSELRTKFDAIRYVTSIRRPEDILDTAAVWGLEFFQDMWDSYNHEKNKTAALRIQLERARKAYEDEVGVKVHLIKRAENAEVELRKLIKIKAENEARADAVILEQARAMAATVAECDAKLGRARAELDLCRQELMKTQGQWADSMRDAEREKVRLREVAAAARRDQALSTHYNADARRTMISAYNETSATRARLSTCLFQLAIYKTLSQKLRQEVVVAVDQLAIELHCFRICHCAVQNNDNVVTRMQHLGNLAVLRREASDRETQLLEAQQGTGIMAVKQQLQSSEEALNRSLTHSKGLQTKLEFQRVSLARAAGQLERQARNIDRLTAAVKERMTLQPGETIAQALVLDEEPINALHPLLKHVGTNTDEQPPGGASGRQLGWPTLAGADAASGHAAATGSGAVGAGWAGQAGALRLGGHEVDGDESHWPELAARGAAASGGAGGDDGSASGTAAAGDGADGSEQYDYSQYPWVYTYATGEWFDASAGDHGGAEQGEEHAESSGE